MSRVSLIIGGVAADLFAGEDITLVKQAKDLTDLGATRTDFSRPFTIPATDTNNGIFTHFYNLDISDPYPVHNKAEASISVKGVQIFEGVLELMNVTLKNNIPDSYEVNFYGRNKQLTTLWGDNTLQDLDFNLDHALTAANIKASWAGTLSSGKVRYPVIDFGAKESGAFIYNRQAGYLTDNNIAKAVGAISPLELRPAVRLQTAIEQCFTHISKTITLDSSISDDALYMMGMDTDGVLKWNHDGRFSATKESISISASFTETTLTSYASETDPNNLFNVSTGEYNPGAAGVHTFRVSFTNWSDIDFRVRARDTAGKNLGTSGVLRAGSLLTAADTFEFNATIPFGSPNVVFTILKRSSSAANLTFNSMTIECIENPSLPDAPDITIEQTMPDMKISDFIKKVLTTFNSVLTTSDGVAYTMTPLTTYLDAGSTKNWTDRIDTSVVKIDKQNVPDSVVLKHQESDDDANKTFRDAFKSDYGSIEFENKGLFDFTDDALEVESPFTILPISYQMEQDAVGQNIPTDLEIYSYMDSDGKPIKADLSLFYFAGYQTASTFGSSVLAYTWFFDEGTSSSSNPVAQTKFPFFRSFSARPAVSGSNSVTFSRAQDEDGVVPINTLFDRFWKDHLFRVFDLRMRRVQMTAYLETTDWLDLEINDTIEIATRPYKIEKISYNMTEGRATLDLFTYDQRAGAIPTFDDDQRVTFNQTPTARDRKLAGARKIQGTFYRQPDVIRRGRGKTMEHAQTLTHHNFLLEPRVLNMKITSSNTTALSNTDFAVIDGYNSSTINTCDCFTHSLTNGDFEMQDSFLVEVVFTASYLADINKDLQFTIFVEGTATNFTAFSSAGETDVNMVALLDLKTGDEVDIRAKKSDSGSANLEISTAEFIIRRAR